MRLFKWLVILVIVTFLGSILHYTLPQRDVVRILDAYEKRMDVASNSFFWAQADAGTLATDTRDVRFIDTIRPDGAVMVFRNEDTGFGWPPYFKFDSSDLSAQAKQLASNEADAQWVAVRHYGWRNKFFSIFPNATSMKPVDGPDVTFIPWFNIIFFTFFGLILLGIYRLLQKFKRDRIDPVLDDVGETWDTVEAGGSRMGNAIRGWFKKLGGH
jgi:hypothetical protein